MIDSLYDLGESFEASLVLGLCTSSKLFARIGREVDPDKLTAKEAQLLVQAARLFAADTGRGPGDPNVVVERLHALRRAGRVSQDQINSCQKYLLTAAPMSDENILSVVIPVLQQRLRSQALLAATQAFGKSAPMDEVVRLEERAKRLEKGEEATFELVEADDLKAEIRRVRMGERLRIGTFEIDSVIGGLGRGMMGLVMAPTGGGKTAFCTQQLAVASAVQKVAACATNETQPTVIKMRYIAALTGLLIDEVEAWAVNDDKTHDVLIRTAIEKSGRFVVSYFTPGATTVRDLADWVSDIEAKYGVKVDLLVVDMIDKLTDGRKESGAYETGKAVCEALCAWAADGMRWVWGASHLQRSAGVGGRLATNENAADSMHKPRSADLVLILNLTQDRQIQPEITKNRDGSPCLVDPPLDNAFAHGCAFQSDFLFTWRSKLC